MKSRNEWISEIRALVFSIGGVIVDESENSARFALPGGKWSFALFFERYEPTPDLYLVSPEGQKFATWHLMKAYEKKHSTNLGPPNFVNQVHFVGHTDILANLSEYKTIYESL